MIYCGNLKILQKKRCRLLFIFTPAPSFCPLTCRSRSQDSKKSGHSDTWQQQETKEMTKNAKKELGYERRFRRKKKRESDISVRINWNKQTGIKEDIIKDKKRTKQSDEMVCDDEAKKILFLMRNFWLVSIFLLIVISH